MKTMLPIVLVRYEIKLLQLVYFNLKWVTVWVRFFFQLEVIESNFVILNPSKCVTMCILNVHVFLSPSDDPDIVTSPRSTSSMSSLFQASFACG